MSKRPDALISGSRESFQNLLRGEVLIADASVEQLQVLLSGLRDGVQVHLISSQDDAIGTIAQALSANLDTLHILGHGAPGEVTNV
jgi:hypothetical protein